MSALDQILKQYDAKIFLLVGLAAGAVVYFSMGPGDQEYRPQIKGLSQEVERSEKKLKEAIEVSQNKAKFQDEIERVSKTFRLVLDYLPQELDVQDLLRKIYSEARGAGVELLNFKPKDVLAKDFYDEVPMEIKVKGSFQQIMNFLASISKLPRIINIRDLNIGTPSFVDGQPLLQMSGVLVGYRYKDKR